MRLFLIKIKSNPHKMIVLMFCTLNFYWLLSLVSLEISGIGIKFYVSRVDKVIWFNYQLAIIDDVNIKVNYAFIIIQLSQRKFLLQQNFREIFAGSNLDIKFIWVINILFHNNNEIFLIAANQQPMFDQIYLSCQLSVNCMGYFDIFFEHSSYSTNLAAVFAFKASALEFSSPSNWR